MEYTHLGKCRGLNIGDVILREKRCDSSALQEWVQNERKSLLVLEHVPGAVAYYL